MLIMDRKGPKIIKTSQNVFIRVGMLNRDHKGSTPRLSQVK